MDNKNISINIHKLTDDQRVIAECIGVESYYKLSQTFGGSSIYIARPGIIAQRELRNASIIEDFNNGLSYRDLAYKYGLSDVWIRNIIDGKR